MNFNIVLIQFACLCDLSGGRDKEPVEDRFYDICINSTSVKILKLMHYMMDNPLNKPWITNVSL